MPRGKYGVLEVGSGEFLLFAAVTKQCFFFFVIPSGKWTNHKGRSRRFTNPDELEEQRKREEQERRWKTARGDEESSSEEEKPATKGDKSNSEDETESDSESDEDSDDVSFGSRRLRHNCVVRVFSAVLMGRFWGG